MSKISAMERFTLVQHQEIGIRMMVKSLGQHPTFGLDPDVIRLVLVANEVNLEMDGMKDAILEWTGRAHICKDLWVQATINGSDDPPFWCSLDCLRVSDVEDIETLTSN